MPLTTATAAGFVLPHDPTAVEDSLGAVIGKTADAVTKLATEFDSQTVHTDPTESAIAATKPSEAYHIQATENWTAVAQRLDALTNLAYQDPIQSGGRTAGPSVPSGTFTLASLDVTFHRVQMVYVRLCLTDISGNGGAGAMNIYAVGGNANIAFLGQEQFYLIPALTNTAKPINVIFYGAARLPESRVPFAGYLRIDTSLANNGYVVNSTLIGPAGPNFGLVYSLVQFPIAGV